MRWREKNKQATLSFSLPLPLSFFLFILHRCVALKSKIYCSKKKKEGEEEGCLLAVVECAYVRWEIEMLAKHSPWRLVVFAANVSRWNEAEKKGGKERRRRRKRRVCVYIFLDGNRSCRYFYNASHALYLFLRSLACRLYQVKERTARRETTINRVMVSDPSSRISRNDRHTKERKVRRRSPYLGCERRNENTSHHA